MLFSEFVELIETEQPGGSARAPQPDPQFSQLSSIIGAALPRIDGPLKTSGAALYAADYHFPGMVHAVPVTSTIAAGTIRNIDASKAQSMPGVVLVLTHENIGPLFRMAPGGRGGRTSEARRRAVRLRRRPAHRRLAGRGDEWLTALQQLLPTQRRLQSTCASSRHRQWRSSGATRNA